MRRSVVVGTTLVVAMAVGAPAAFADDLTDVLDRAQGATYTATRLTVSVWGDETRLTRERVERAKGSEMILVDQTWTMVGNGRSIIMNDTPEGIAFMTSLPPVPTDRYTIGITESCRHMYRSCTLVPILENGFLRAELIVDDRTGAPMISRLYDGDGHLFRRVWLADFKPHRTYEWTDDPSQVPVEVVMNDDADGLSDEIAGYLLGEVFAGPIGDGSAQGYYSDGLFGFSLFLLPTSTVVDGFDDAGTLAIPSGAYSMVLTATDVRVYWSHGDRRFVLMGDLPPDHLEAVLGDLPAPDQKSLLARIWAKLFG